MLLGKKLNKNKNIAANYDSLTRWFYKVFQHLWFYVEPEKSLVAQSDAHPNCDQKVTGSIPTGSGNIILCRLIMKYFLIFSPFHWFKKGSC